MDVLVTTRFVDWEVLAAIPDDPDAADMPIGTPLTVTPPRALELVTLGFVALADAGIGMSDLEQAARDFAAVAAPLLPVPASADPSDGGPVDLSK